MWRGAQSRAGGTKHHRGAGCRRQRYQAGAGFVGCGTAAAVSPPGDVGNLSEILPCRKLCVPENKSRSSVCVAVSLFSPGKKNPHTWNWNFSVLVPDLEVSSLLNGNRFARSNDE